MGMSHLAFTMRGVSIDSQLRSLAERQHGLVARRQARAIGLSTRAVHRRLSGRHWESVCPRVLRLAGAPCTDAQRAMAAVLDAGPGTVLSHSSAAAWWGIPGFRLDPLHVSSPRDEGRGPAPLASVHLPRLLPPEHCKTLDGVPVASPALLIFQLAGQVHPLRVERACDNAWAMGLVSGGGLHALLDQLGEHGRNGIAVMRKILAERPPDYVPPASGLECRFASILEEDGQEPMRRQVDVGGKDWVGRVDFADPSLPLLVEINSERYHSALLDRRADQARYQALQAAGFTVLVFWDTEIWHEPHRVVLEVRRARVALRAGLPVLLARKAVG